MQDETTVAARVLSGNARPDPARPVALPIGNCVDEGSGGTAGAVRASQSQWTSGDLNDAACSLPLSATSAIESLRAVRAGPLAPASSGGSESERHDAVAIGEQPCHVRGRHPASVDLL